MAKERLAFTSRYSAISKVLINEIGVSHVFNRKNIDQRKAIWDTGATLIYDNDISG